jgi:hypothetical protein
MKQLLVFLVIGLNLSSCITYKSDPLPAINSSIPALSPFPIKPNLTIYTRQPIISKQDNNFVVSGEFLENSLMYKKYSDAIDGWKKDNSIK